MLILVVEMMVEAWVVEGLDDGFVTGPPGFSESSGKTSETVSHPFSISPRCIFVSLKRRSGECCLRCLLTNA